MIATHRFSAWFDHIDSLLGLIGVQVQVTLLVFLNHPNDYTLLMLVLPLIGGFSISVETAATMYLFNRYRHSLPYQ